MRKSSQESSVRITTHLPSVGLGMLRALVQGLWVQTSVRGSRSLVNPSADVVPSPRSNNHLPSRIFVTLVPRRVPPARKSPSLTDPIGAVQSHHHLMALDVIGIYTYTIEYTEIFFHATAVNLFVHEFWSFIKYRIDHLYSIVRHVYLRTVGFSRP